MPDDELGQALLLQGRITAFVRAFGLHQPDRTPCGRPVPISEAHAVSELDRDGPMTQTTLAGRLRLEKSTVSRLVAQLIGRGWVRRVERDGDARLVWLELTPDGSRAAGELAAARAARFADLLRNIPAERRTAVVDALTTLVEAAAGQPESVGAGRGRRG
jgi:DNA-binding MarR family transcriptional regulator